MSLENNRVANPLPDFRSERCGHNFLVQECPYQFCGYRDTLESLRGLMDALKLKQPADTVKYVAGFLFNDDASAVALIHKTHGPDCMIGKWNAIGGKVKRGAPGMPDESSAAAMWREFQEEAGADVRWTLFLTLKGQGWKVDFYHAFSSEALSLARTREVETVAVFPIDSLPETVPNLKWIIPMALGHQNDHVWVYEVTEKETFAAPSKVQS